mmetsp:Transcript_4177/g.10581  ORF Transcript_4177/g.10581 Transcript_4177/m.10581 type:complete len:94 (-) Transcript_4177:99-380(-)
MDFVSKMMFKSKVKSAQKSATGAMDDMFGSESKEDQERKKRMADKDKAERDARQAKLDEKAAKRREERESQRANLREKYGVKEKKVEKKGWFS